MCSRYGMHLASQSCTLLHLHAMARSASGMALQVAVFLRQQLGSGTEVGSQDVGTLLRSPALAYFIRNTVTIHSVLTHRIDHLRPSVQLTLKVATVMGMRVGPPATL